MNTPIPPRYVRGKTDLFRRLGGIAAFVILFNTLLYFIFLFAPGGPLSGLKLSDDRRTRVSDADIARLESWLGGYSTGAAPASRIQPQTQTSPWPLSAGGTDTVNDEPYDLTFYENYGVNPFVDAEEDSFSTFAMDVDTAAYTVMRRYVRDGFLPEKDSVRVEEYLNYFKYDYRAPGNSELAFAINLEGGPSPFGSERHALLQIGLQGYELLAEERKPALLVFVVDVSGSMDREDRLGLVKQALRLLVNELYPEDTVGIVVYGSTGRAVLSPTSVKNKEAILATIESLQTEGATNAEEGLILGYKMAAENAIPSGINRIILCSDGVANVGNTGADSILNQIEDYAEQGIYLTTVGFGMGNYNDVLMEQLANKGDGQYAYVDTLPDAERVFVQNLTGTLLPIAKDAKVQVVFNPEVVRSYRLLGYENRDIADEDFRDDTVDAGEVGAGHSVTALYELKFMPGATGTAVTVYVRYEHPETGDIYEIGRKYDRADFKTDLASTSPRFRFAAAVAEYAEILRESYWAKDGSLEAVLALLYSTVSEMSDNEDAAAFSETVEQAADLWAKYHPDDE